MRVTKEQIRSQQQANEDACKIFGHLPDPIVKPAGFGEMHKAMKMRCARCGHDI